MKKILYIVLILFYITGCGNNTAKMAVEEHLNKYRNLDSEVLVSLENVINNKDLTNDQQEKYRSVLKKQYQDLAYEIVKEEYNDNISYVTVKVSVYDLFRAQSDASIYLSNNPEEFYNDNNEYDVTKYIDYKLDKMNDMLDKVEYTIVFTVYKEDDNYIVEDLTADDLEKIHGVYNYELG